MARALGYGQEQAVGSEQRGERRATCDAQRPVRLRGPYASKVTGEPTPIEIERKCVWLGDNDLIYSFSNLKFVLISETYLISEKLY